MIIDGQEVLLKDITTYQTAKARVIAKLDELGNLPVKEAFASKVTGKSAPFSFQTLANLTWQSVGYIRDKFLKWRADTQSDECEWERFVLDNMVPMSKEELEALAKKEKHDAEIVAKAQAVIDTAETLGNALTVESTEKNDKLREKIGDEAFSKLLELLTQAK